LNPVTSLTPFRLYDDLAQVVGNHPSRNWVKRSVPAVNAHGGSAMGQRWTAYRLDLAFFSAGTFAAPL
jgi:hypothetical protein